MSVNAIGTRVLRTPKLPEDDALRPFIAIVELLVVNFFNDEFERLESLMPSRVFLDVNDVDAFGNDKGFDLICSSIVIDAADVTVDG